MEISSKKHVVTSCDELLSHEGWHECVNSRRKIKGHGNRVFRTFELDCGSNYKITLWMTEAIGFSLTSLQFSKPYMTVCFRTTYGQYSSRMTDIKGCTNREDFYKKLYSTLAKRFPLTDLDVQEVKVA